MASNNFQLSKHAYWQLQITKTRFFRALFQKKIYLAYGRSDICHTPLGSIVGWTAVHRLEECFTARLDGSTIPKGFSALKERKTVRWMWVCRIVGRWVAKTEFYSTHQNPFRKKCGLKAKTMHGLRPESFSAPRCDTGMSDWGSGFAAPLRKICILGSYCYTKNERQTKARKENEKNELYAVTSLSSALRISLITGIEFHRLVQTPKFMKLKERKLLSLYCHGSVKTD